MPKKMSSNLEQCVSAPSSRRLDGRPKAQRDPSQCLHGMASGVIIVQLFPPFHERQVGFSVEHGASVWEVYPRRRFSQQEVIILQRVGSFQLQTKTKIDMRQPGMDKKKPPKPLALAFKREGTRRRTQVFPLIPDMVAIWPLKFIFISPR